MPIIDKRWTEFLHFTNKEWDATLATEQYKYLLYGGTRGCSKSHWLRRIIPHWLIKWYQEYGIRNIPGMLMAETYGTLTDRQVTKIASEFPEWLGTIKKTQVDGFGFYLHEQHGGGKMLFRNLDDPNKYKGLEVAIIGVDQLEQQPEERFEILNGSLRYPGIPEAKFVASGNPLGIGHAWNLAYFIEKRLPKNLQADKDRFGFVRARPEDNPYLSDDYWDFLKSLSPMMRKAWWDGDYYTFQGQAFPQFNTITHVIPWSEMPPKWSHWTKWVAIDWGFTKPWCCLWFTIDPDNGRIYIYREAYATELTDREQARKIKDSTPQEEVLAYAYADPSMWTTKNMMGVISSTADEYAQNGIPLTRADNDRLSGKRKIDRLLGNLPDGRPGVLILETCYNFIRTFPALTLNEKKPEDVNTEQEDHAYDAFRYGLTAARTYMADNHKKTTPSPFEKIKGL